MLIWGWKTIFRVVGNGVFSCPTCGADRNYQRRKAQRFFTLFFIPLIPVKTLGEFIRCTHCKNDFRESVLARPTAAQFSDLLQNTVRGVMVHVLRSGGWDAPGARAAAVHEIVSAGAVGYAEPNLAQDMQVVPADLSPMLASLAGQLPDSGREALLTGAVRVAAADGPVQPAERAVIDSVGAALGMSQVYVGGIVGSVAPGVPVTGPATGPVPGGQPQAPVWGAPVPTPAPAPASGGPGMETLLIQAPQPAPATGAQDAVPPQTPAPAPASAMETMLIQAPQPASAAPVQDAGSGKETMLIQAPQPQPPSSSMETAVIPIPQPAAPVVPAPEPTVPAPPPTMVDPSSSMETAIIPIPQPRPDRGPGPAEKEPGPGAVAWPPPQQ